MVSTDEDVPSSPPNNVTAWQSPDVPGRILINWATPSPSDTNGQVTKYLVKAYAFVDPSRKWHRHVYEPFYRPVQMTGLWNFTLYCVQVSAFTQKGKGPSSACVNITTAEAAPSSPPVNLTAINVTTTSITLSWGPIAEKHKNGIIKGFTIWYSSELESTPKVVRVHGEETSNVTINSLLPMTIYQVRISGFNGAGDGTTSDFHDIWTSQTAPTGSPRVINASSFNSTSVVLSWNILPRHQSGYVTGYTVFYTSQEHQGSVFFSSTLPNATVGSLMMFTSYCFRVAVNNTVGTGAPGPCYNISTDQDVPSQPPENVSACAVNSTAVNVTWSRIPQKFLRGIQNGSVIVARRIIDTSSNLSPLVTSCESNAILGNLEPFTQYCVTVAALTIKGAGPWSDCVTVTTHESAPAGPPLNVSAYNTSSTSLRITWLPVHPDFRHGIILGYHVRVYGPSPFQGASVNHSMSQNATSVLHSDRNLTVNASMLGVEVDELQKFTMYSVRVTAYNSAGEGRGSDVISVMTDEDAPSGSPLNVSAYNTSSTSLRITWLPVHPDFRHGIILGYHVRVYGHSPFQGASVNHSMSQNATSVLHSDRNLTVNASMLGVEVDELQKFTMYSVRVTAYNSAGEGRGSDVISVMTDEDAPSGSPLNVSAYNTSSTSLRITWLPVHPDFRHGIILGYHVRVYGHSPFQGASVNHSMSQNATSVLHSDRNLTVNASMLGVEVDELQKFTMYSVRVTAYNSAGEGRGSDVISVMTDEDVPEVPPSHVVGKNLSSTSVQLKWEMPPLAGLHGRLVGFNVTIYRYDQEGFLVTKPYKEFQVEAETTSAVLDQLHKGLQFCVKIAAFTKYGSGNYSNCSFVATNEEPPSLPPQNSTIKSTGPTALRVTWEPIPWQHSNGVILGYIIRLTPTKETRRRRRRSVEYSDGVISVKVSKGTTSYEFKDLEKDTVYCAELLAFTAAGTENGTSCVMGHTQSLENIIPNVTLSGSPGPESIKVLITLKDRDILLDSGLLVRYDLQYRVSKVSGKEVVSSEKTRPVVLQVAGNANEVELNDLETYTTYEIEAAVVTKDEGRLTYSTVLYAETCKCPRSLLTNWYQHPPFTALNSDHTVAGVIPPILTSIVTSTCGVCQNSPTFLDITSPQDNATIMKENLDATMDMSFPVSAIKGQVNVAGLYVPLVKIPGVLVLSRQEPAAARYAKVVVSSIFQCWPIVVINVCFMLLAGVIIWALEHGRNKGQFPNQVIPGIQEGVWWAIATMTTVGYGDRSPLSLAGRLFAVVWSLVGIIMASMLIASISSSLTITVVDEISSSGVTRGERIAAVMNSPEYNAAERVARGRAKFFSYPNITSLINAFQALNVTSIVVDPYTVQSRPDLFNDTWYKISNIISEEISYGVILGGNAVKLERHISEYVSSNVMAVSMDYQVDNSTNTTDSGTIKVSQGETVNFLDPSSPIFREGLQYCGLVLAGMVLLGVTYHVLYYIQYRGSRMNTCPKDSYFESIQEMRNVLEEFHQNFCELYKHLRREQLWKSDVKKCQL
ncbi:phosphatidylinositol phosphatase PTPRQ-like [Nematostella vectensis]|uniref:phosphatidylinositol phosphatase PTPRQ-like n=1 Tax=Nematostella vectensis TaxID=45351 RepID=UPI002077895E|nr:phosphatidylinositol phosphatase PTPRQ-like [Nematostella vectensis]